MLLSAEMNWSRTEISGLSVELAGPDNARPVIFSAGLGGKGGYWRREAEMLADSYRVILYDHRGTGNSERLALAEGFAPSDFGADITLLIDGLDLDGVTIVGHAAGAVAGIYATAARSKAIEALVLVNGWLRPDPHFLRCFELRKAIYEGLGVDMYLRSQPLFLYPAGWISAHTDELDKLAVAHAIDFPDKDTLFKRIEALALSDMSLIAPELDCRVLLVSAQDDMLVPVSCSNALAEAIPRARHLTFERGGHAVNITNPIQFDEGLRSFLDHQLQE